MKNSNGSFVRVGCAILILLVFSQHHLVFAGWTGLINGKSVGYASVNVRPSTSLVTNFLTTLNNTTNPSAAMAPMTGYKTNAALPTGASAATYARVKSISGGILQGSAVPS